MAIATRVAYGEVLAGLGNKYEFVVFDADLAKATQTVQFAKAFPNRFFDMGISEQDMIGTAAGFASTGITAVASTFAMFACGRAYEQIRNAVAYNNLPVKICATHAGVLIGEDGPSHQCVEDIALMRVIPGMIVLSPCDEFAVRSLLEQAIQNPGPVYMRLGRTSSPSVYNAQSEIKMGKGNVLKDGDDVTIVATGDLVYEALKAAQQLESEGISAAVIDVHTIKPIDSELIEKYAEKTKRILTCEDHSIVGGLGSAVADVVSVKCSAEVHRLGIDDRFGTSGSREDLQVYFGLNSEKIIEKIKYWSTEGE